MNEVWGPYLILYAMLTAGCVAIVLLILLGVGWRYLRQHGKPYLFLLRIMMQLYATVLFIPCFSIRLWCMILALYGNVLRCIPSKGRLSWKVFPTETCFSGIHITLTVVGLVGAFCHILIAFLYGISCWDNSLRSKSMFAK